MACIKTGCWVYFVNYSCRVRADAYEVGNCYIFRWNVGSEDFTAPIESNTFVVGAVFLADEWWHRKDLGVTVVPKDEVTYVD